MKQTKKCPKWLTMPLPQETSHQIHVKDYSALNLTVVTVTPKVQYWLANDKTITMKMNSMRYIKKHENHVTRSNKKKERGFSGLRKVDKIFSWLQKISHNQVCTIMLNGSNRSNPYTSVQRNNIHGANWIFNMIRNNIITFKIYLKRLGQLSANQIPNIK